MKQTIFFMSLIILSSISCFSQETHLRNSKWFFYNNQMDFASLNSQPCSPIWNSTTDVLNHLPTTSFYNPVYASVCDFDGSPLIKVYGYGDVWTKYGSVGSISISSRNVTIVPKPNHLDRYYIICSSDYGLNYTEVDLTNKVLLNVRTPFNDLNGQPILRNLEGCDVATTVHANGTDYWIAAVANNNLMTYLITENGINAIPVNSMNLASSQPSGTFKVKICPKSNYNEPLIAVLNLNTGVTIKGFNTNTGTISNNYVDYSGNSYNLMQMSAQYSSTYGIFTRSLEFSSDGSIWYYIDSDGLSTLKSGTITYLAPDYVTAQLGPDGNVYFATEEGYFDATSPNNNYIDHVQPFLPTYGEQRIYLPKLVSFNKSMTPTKTTFNDVALIDNTSNYILPNQSTNTPPIYGNWSPATITEGDNIYTFTPNIGQCATRVIQSYLYLKQLPTPTIQANEDYLQAYVISSDVLTSSVLDNDTKADGTIVTTNDVTVSVESMSVPQSYLDMQGPLPTLKSDGTINIPWRFYNGVFSVTYRIAKNECLDDYSIATTIVTVGDGTVWSRKAQTISNKIVIYPNPSTGVFRIDLVEAQGDYDTVEVFNMLGTKVYEDRLQPKDYNGIDLSDMTTGCYIAKISGKDGSQSFQLIKQ